MNSTFKINFNDWELDSLFELMDRPEGYNMNPKLQISFVGVLRQRNTL